MPQSIVAVIFAAMQEKSRNTGKRKTRGSTKMPQIRTIFVDNILLKCSATTHSARVQILLVSRLCHGTRQTLFV